MNNIINLLNIIFLILDKEKMSHVRVMYSKKIGQSFFSLLKDTHEGVLVIKDDWPYSKDEIESLAFYSYLALKHVEDKNNTKEVIHNDVRIYEDPIKREAATFATLFMYKLTSLMLTKRDYKDLRNTCSSYSQPFDIRGMGFGKKEELEIQNLFNKAYKDMKEVFIPKISKYDDDILEWLKDAELI